MAVVQLSLDLNHLLLVLAPSFEEFLLGGILPTEHGGAGPPSMEV